MEAKLKLRQIGLLLVMVALVILDANAQCPMCRLSAESNLANGGTEGQGLNAGILYMLAAPYLLVGTVAFLWWRHRRKGGDVLED